MRDSTPTNNNAQLPNNISIHEPLAGLDGIYYKKIYGDLISIHEPLAGLDIINAEVFMDNAISIHEPLAGLDLHRRG